MRFPLSLLFFLKKNGGDKMKYLNQKFIQRRRHGRMFESISKAMIILDISFHLLHFSLFIFCYIKFIFGILELLEFVFCLIE